MILVDDAGGEWPAIGHAPWNGCNLADFVMPFFLFIVGMAIPLSLKVSCEWENTVAKIAFVKYLHSLFIFFFLFWLKLKTSPLFGCFLFDIQKIPNKLLAVKKVIVRTLKLLFWGLLLQG